MMCCLDIRRPGHDFACLKDAASTLLGVVWVVGKEMPERRDYSDPQLLRERGPRLTWGIRTYGLAHGHGVAYAFSEYALERLPRDRPEGRSVWYQTKAENKAVRVLGERLGIFEVSGEAGGTAIGVRFSP